MKLLKKFSFLLLVLILSMVTFLTACGNDAAEETPAPAPAEEETDDTDQGEETAEGSYLERAYAREFEGTSVTIMGNFGDEQELLFQETLTRLGDETGIDVTYEQTDDPTTTFGIRYDGGNPPDIIIVSRHSPSFVVQGFS